MNTFLEKLPLKIQELSRAKNTNRGVKFEKRVAARTIFGVGLKLYKKVNTKTG